MPDENMIVDDVAEDVAAAIVSVNESAAPEPAPEVKTEAPVETKGEPARTDGRDELGRFAKKADEKTEPVKEVVQDIRQGNQSTAQQPDKTQPAPTEQPAQARTAPPPGWSIKSKSHWDKLPQEVRDDIAKREVEVSNGFKEYQGLRPFSERARASG